jgi:hypothetical protein
MGNLLEILVITMAVFSFVFLLLFIRSRFVGASGKILLIELGGCIAFATISLMPLIPGSETNFELGPIKYKIKSPSKIAKLAGAKEKTFEAQNTDISNTNTIIFSASSTTPSISPDLNFLTGKEYIKTIGESKDGKERIFSATLPPGKGLKTASPEQVTISVLPNSFISKLFDFKKFPLSAKDAEAIQEYYNLEKNK